MPQLAFFPWATVEEPVVVGAFRIVPYGVAVKTGEIPADLAPLTTQILSTYEGHAREVDRAGTPVLHLAGRGLTDTLTDEEAATLFAFREQLAFAGLAARDLFGHRYIGSDHLQLVLQSFAPGDSGAVVTVTRRRDGSVRNIVSKDRVKEMRPDHVTGACSIPGDIDLPLLGALQAADRLRAEEKERLADIVHLWVGANTDNRAVSWHSEVVDTVSIFNRLADAFKVEPIIEAFVALVPPPPKWGERAPSPGSRGAAAMADAATHDEPIRAIWLRDLIQLRHNHGHGRIASAEKRVRWSRFEHMCIADIAVPLAVKAWLAGHGLYSRTETDAAEDRFLDAVILLDPPTPMSLNDDDDVDEGEDDDTTPSGQPSRRPQSFGKRWQRARVDAMLWPEIERLAAAMEQEFGEKATEM